jgi:hypothetical protein
VNRGGIREDGVMRRASHPKAQRMGAVAVERDHGIVDWDAWRGGRRGGEQGEDFGVDQGGPGAWRMW